PPGFQDSEYPNRVYKVKKAMYGLHQAPKVWYEFKALMHDKFQMSAMGELTFFLGLQVLQKKDGIFLLQDKYIGDILKKFRYSDVRSANTPMDKENPWGKDGPGKDVELHLYRSMTRSLMYLTTSRPYIMFDVCACTIVATSTTELEYVAAASGCRQVLWIQNQMLDYREVPVLSCEYWNA
nr:ribonuclease H-like domain, reverse transcriptase, RNA-dependent DNA polymerase [Tanacetum cinerariifolium]